MLIINVLVNVSCETLVFKLYMGEIVTMFYSNRSVI